MNVNRLPARVIHAAGLSACGVVLLVTYLAGVRPLLQRRDESGRDRQVLAEQRKKSAAAAAAVARSRARLDGVQASLAGQPLRLRPAPAVNACLSDLTTLASSVGMQIQDVQPGEGVKRPYYVLVPLHTAGRGGYESCARFMHAVHERFPDVSVVNFRLTGHPEGTAGDEAFEMNLSWCAAAGESPAAAAE